MGSKSLRALLTSTRHHSCSTLAISRDRTRTERTVALSRCWTFPRVNIVRTTLWGLAVISVVSRGCSLLAQSVPNLHLRTSLRLRGSCVESQVATDRHCCTRQLWLVGRSSVGRTRRTVTRRSASSMVALRVQQLACTWAKTRPTRQASMQNRFGEITAPHGETPS